MSKSQRTSQERRRNSINKALSRRELSRQLSGKETYDNLHQFSKNGIQPPDPDNPPKERISDLRRRISADQDEADF